MHGVLCPPCITFSFFLPLLTPHPTPQCLFHPFSRSPRRLLVSGTPVWSSWLAVALCVCQQTVGACVAVIGGKTSRGPVEREKQARKKESKRMRREGRDGRLMGCLGVSGSQRGTAPLSPVSGGIAALVYTVCHSHTCHTQRTLSAPFSLWEKKKCLLFCFIFFPVVVGLFFCVSLVLASRCSFALACD